MNTIKKFCKISDYLACSGQPNHEQLALLAQEKYEVIINIGLYNTDYLLPNEQGVVELLGTGILSYSVLFDKPQKENIFWFF